MFAAKWVQCSTAVVGWRMEDRRVTATPTISANLNGCVRFGRAKATRAFLLVFTYAMRFACRVRHNKNIVYSFVFPPFSARLWDWRHMLCRPLQDLFLFPSAPKFRCVNVKTKRGGGRAWTLNQLQYTSNERLFFSRRRKEQNQNRNVFCPLICHYPRLENTQEFSLNM